MTRTGVSGTPRPLLMVRLLAGRGSFRLGVQVMAVVLAATWGADGYGRFTNALGACSWLVFVPTAAEKAALKVIPRTRRITGGVAGLALRIAAAPALALGGALLVALLVAPDGAVSLYLATACWWTCTGLLMTVSGLHRLAGRPALDAVAFAAAAAVVVAGTAATWLAGLAPRTHVLLLLAGIALVTATAVAALPRGWVRPGRSGRRLLPAFGRSTGLLGLSELLDAATISAIYLVLAWAGRVTDSGPFYLAMMVSSFVCSFLLYQFKLHQPAVSASVCV